MANDILILNFFFQSSENHPLSNYNHDGMVFYHFNKDRDANNKGNSSLELVLNGIAMGNITFAIDNSFGAAEAVLGND